MNEEQGYVRWFEELGARDVPLVGGKNASLGEMMSALRDAGIRVPEGFAVTTCAYWSFVRQNGMEDKIRTYLDSLKDGTLPLPEVGRRMRSLFLDAQFPQEIAEAIRGAYQELSRRCGVDEVDVAVRSSATAEDLSGASFAGQQETFLNVTGEGDLLDACRRCCASLFTDRAISYREQQGFDHMEVALSVGVQRMVRSDKGSAGVIFTLDTESGFPDVVIINAAWGLGENVVQGTVTPDEYLVFKRLLDRTHVKPIIEKTLGEKERKTIYAKEAGKTTKTVDTSIAERRSFVLEDGEILQLARWACLIEDHYARPMDIEWARDGETSELFILQARPETVQSRNGNGSLKTYTLKERGRRILDGIAVGQALAAGKVCRIRDADQMDAFKDGSVLVTAMTDPDWVPIMERAAGIITDYGGRTCHAAIVSRELGIPAVVGTGEATEVLEDEQEITLSCCEGDRGYVYDGILEYEETDVSLEEIPQTRTRIMMNIASPSAAFRWWRLPCRGIGLARMEFIISNIIKIHPMALVRFDEVDDEEARAQIERLTRGYDDKTEYFIDRLARGISRIAASQYPEPVIVRMSDFKTNEYAELIGGRQFEPEEANPMLGFRGASRYYSDRYREGFVLECRAIRRVREVIGLTNVMIMIPFCRTVEEADLVLGVLARNGLRRGEDELQIYVMCEVPSNVVLADEFAERFDGFSIGSNDLTQLVLGVDRDSSDLAGLFSEQNEAVRRMIGNVIKSAHRAGRKVGICGQAPSDYPEYAAFLVGEGIDSISVSPDSVIGVIESVAMAEREMSSAYASREAHTAVGAGILSTPR